MANQIEQINNTPVDKFRYKSRYPYYQNAKHKNDDFKNLGYEYRGKLLQKTTSPELWANPIQIPFYARIESLIVFVLEQVKMIKKIYSIAHSKDDLKIN